MQTDQVERATHKNKELKPAFSALSKINEIFMAAAELDDDEEIRAVLEKALGLCDQAGKIFLEKDQAWLGAWTDIRKASLHCELAQIENNTGRAVQIHAAMELLRKVMDSMETVPPSADMAAKLYNGMIDTLFRIRSFFDEEEQLEAINAFIQGLAENLGEAMAVDLSLRAEANDLKFTAGILEALADLEEDPREKEEILKNSQELSQQAAENLLLSGTREMAWEE